MRRTAVHARCLTFLAHASNDSGGCRFGVADLARRFWRQLRTRKAARILAAGLTLVCYVKLRSFLAVDQLVRMYREVTPARSAILLDVD